MAATPPTIAEVKEIKPTVMDDASVTARIDTAGVIVGQLNSKCGLTLSDAILTEVQLWLSAHLVSITEKNTKRENVLQTDMDVTYQTGTLGAGIQSTVEGQTANMLACGCLSQFDQMQSQIVFA